ncbi:MAG: T9SS type A sorting domain-containing protein [Candidatus Eisenbacteria bacterium]|uniref:T9SS type A sorting domain-containing protein n=1 Tax=Eiseniibacteriota bacterium TaxID=2212470 RepID=A0A956NJF9_UNCEI|nr:T9SS type A sorting domain-containing protein [Candidatus Eisenbacteria bacterium]
MILPPVPSAIVTRFTALVLAVSLASLLGVPTGSARSIDEIGPTSTPSPSPRALPSLTPSPRTPASGDTLYFGHVDEDGFAVPGETWTFDHGDADPFEGWTAIDFAGNTVHTVEHGKWITDSTWAMDSVATVSAPILSGAGSLWIGRTETSARLECWEGGLGYGDYWCQRLVSPTFTRDPEASVLLEWRHFNDTERTYDYVHVYLEFLSGEERVELRRYDDQIGLAPTHPVDPPVGTTDSQSLTPEEFQGATEFRIAFEMTSDSGWSDQTGFFVTAYGPVSIDDVTISQSPGGVLGSYDFEDGFQGWVAESCPGFGIFLGSALLDDYVVEDSCEGVLDGHVLELHDDALEHPEGQRVRLFSPPVDVANDVLPYFGDPDSIEIFAEWGFYGDMNSTDGVYYRPGWQYYPYSCGEGGKIGWSPRVGSNTFYYAGHDPVCEMRFDSATDADVPIPPGVEQVRFIYEFYAQCYAFGSTECYYDPNFSPLVDNLRIGFVERYFPAEVAPDPSIGVTRLHGATPNPFRDRTSLRYSLSTEGPVRLSIYDVAGRTVRTLVDAVREPGHYATAWDGMDDLGRAVPSGVYWARFEANGQTLADRLVRLD